MKLRIAARMGSGVGLALFVIGGVPANAQINFEPNWAAWGSQQLSNQQWEIQKEIHKNDWHQNPDGTVTAVHHGTTGRGTVSRRPLASTRYTPSPAVTEQVRQQFFQFIGSRAGAKGEQVISNAFTKTNVLRAWAQNAAQDGLHPNDVADAFTEYWVTNWQMANGVMNAPHEQVKAARNQFARALSANPAFARLTSAQKQALAETYIYNDALLGTAYLGAAKKGDRALQQRLGDAAVTHFKTLMNVDLRQITLSSHGFIPKG